MDDHVHSVLLILLTYLLNFLNCFILGCQYLPYKVIALFRY